MKRAFLWILTGLMLLSLCGCGLFGLPGETEEETARRHTRKAEETVPVSSNASTDLPPEETEAPTEPEPTFPYLEEAPFPPLIPSFQERERHPVEPPFEGRLLLEERRRRLAEIPLEDPSLAAGVWNGIWNGILTVESASGVYSMLGSGPFVTQATIVLGEDGRGTFQITNPFGFPFSSEALLAVGSCEGNAQRLTLLTATVFGAYVEMNQTISAPEDSGGSCRMENGFSSVEGSASFTIVFTKAPER